MSTIQTTTRYGVGLAIALWVLTIILVGLFDLSTITGNALILLSWVLLPVSVASNATVEPTCEKLQAVLYTLGSAIPLLGIVPASIYLGTTSQ